MAGIGFRLQRIMARPTLCNVFRAYTYAAIISSGPLVLSILSLAALGIILTKIGGQTDNLPLFFSSVTTIYCFTLILTSPIQLVLIRFGSDCEYEKTLDYVLPFLFKIMGGTTAIIGMVSFLFFFGGTSTPFIFKLGAVFLSILIANIWLLCGYLTALKNYNNVLGGFAIGYSSSFVLGYLAETCFNADWIMLGFALGHMILLIFFLRCLYQEFGIKDNKDISVFPFFKKYKELAYCGLFYNLGIWSDKIIFWWFAPDRMQVNGLIYAMPLYDQAVYLGFLSIIPGMAVFLLRFETEFAVYYSQFYRSLHQKVSLSYLQRTKNAMSMVLSNEFFHLLKIQGGITLILILFSEKLKPYIGLGALQTGIFQVILIGSFLLVLFLSFLTVLFYLDKRRDALLCCGIFCSVNIICTLFSLYLGYSFYGLGYALAAGTSFLVSVYFVNRHMRNLEYDTFALQPIV